MNEEALNDAYALFSSKGYNGGIKEFKSLIGSNPDALKDSYTVFRSSGYNGDINQYSELIGLKKKGPSDFTTPKVAMESPTGAGSLGPVETQPKKKVTITTPNGTPAVVEWGPTKFKSSDEAPVPDMRLSDIFGNVKHFNFWTTLNLPTFFCILEAASKSIPVTFATGWTGWTFDCQGQLYIS